MKLRTILKSVLLSCALFLIANAVYDVVVPKMVMMAPKAIRAEVSPTQGIKVIVDEDTSWSATLQVLVILVGTYGGIKLINKYTCA